MATARPSTSPRWPRPGILVVLSLAIAWRAVWRLTGLAHGQVDPKAYAFVVLGVVMAIDVSRAVVSHRTARRTGSPALQANALHFASDFAGSTAVLIGMILARHGEHWADSAAALFVAVLVLLAAARLMRVNVDVLMDRVPSEAEAAALQAIGALEPPVELRRLRMRQAAGRQFADVVIGVSPGAAIGQGHAAADAVEAAVHAGAPRQRRRRPRRADADDAALRERALAAAQRVPRVREIHNLSVLDVGSSMQVSLHLKLPGELTLDEAHEIATEVERAIIDGRARGRRGADPPRAAGRGRRWAASATEPPTAR